MSNRLLQTVFRQLVPNAGTIIVVALMLFAYRAGAMPDTAPANPNVTPGVISYQGTLTDATGKPINGNTNITFRLYNVPTGGTALWTEARTSTNSVSVNNGLFNVLLGNLTPIPSTVWSNNTLYLGIQVNSDAEMSPRELVGQVPYAMYTTRADTALTVPDGTITSRKLDANENYKFVTAWESTNSTEWVDLATPHSVAITLDVPQWVYVIYRANIKNLNGGVSYMGISVDGQPVSDENKIEYGGDTTTFNRSSIMGVSRVYLSAGAHTITAKHSVSGGTGEFWHRRILVFAISQ